MRKKYAILFVTSLFFLCLSIPYSIFADDQLLSQVKSTTKREVYQISLGNTDDITTVIQSQFDEKLDDLNTTDSNDGQVIFYNDVYLGVLSGLDIDKQGIQDVVITLTEKKNISTNNVREFAHEKNARSTIRLVHINVVDNQLPTIQSEDVYKIEVGAAIALEEVIQAKDNSGNVILDIDDSQVDYQEKGIYTAYAKAKDKAGNETRKEIKVEVEGDFYQRIADAALSQIGINQDCTMLVTNALKAVGIDFHGAPLDYLSLGTLTNNPVPGDIVVYQGHVALYVGNGMAVHGGWNGYTTILYSVQCTNPIIGYVHVNR